MPAAAIATGAVDLVLPLGEIGMALETIVARGVLPPSRARVAALDTIFGGPGTMRAIFRGIDWASTALGPVEGWPAELVAALQLMLASPTPVAVVWGPDELFFYNDATIPTLPSHPTCAGRPHKLESSKKIFDAVRATGEPFHEEETHVPLEENGALVERYFTITYAPIRTTRGVEGVFYHHVEVTDLVVATRRMATLNALSSVPRATIDIHQALLAPLAMNREDLPFVLAYELTAERRALLKAAIHATPGHSVAPHIVDLVGPRAAWPFRELASGRKSLLVSDLLTRFDPIIGPWGEPISEALLLPLGGDAEAPTSGVLVVGLSRRRPLDSSYRGFIDLVATNVSAGLVEANAIALMRKRAEALAAANRAKTEFFSNISHEFRTPLTLILGQLERTLKRPELLTEEVRSDLDVAVRNAQRLLGLVTSLLDFAAVEAHRVRPRFEKIDLAAETQRVASLFASAVEAAGLRLVVDCPPLSALVPVDREMWGKILVNLLSNALKFTFQGEIRVTLGERPQHAELIVRDTGVGIPEKEQQHVFERYFRGSPQRARTHEGSGIGLALTRELVRLHGGRIRVQSKENEGTTFTLWIPTLGHLRKGQQVADAPPESDPSRRVEIDTLAEAALAWTQSANAPEGIGPGTSGLEDLEAVHTRTRGARVLVVDDHPDMRAYLERLLREMGWEVDKARDGDEAFARVKEVRPDLVLADMMMPKSDGFDLLRRLRADPTLIDLPVVFVTARAGESAAVEGLMAGASDYIAKPFSARELAARLGAQLEIARVRRRAEELNTFLVRFSDAVRGLTGARAVASEACKMAVEHLGAESAHWAEVDWATRELVVESSFTRDRGVDPTGTYPIDAWEPMSSVLLAGRPSIIDDRQADPRLSPQFKDDAAKLDIAARIGMPVMVDGKCRATLSVNQRSPRRWTPEEIAFLEAVASRCWAEVERARTEAALRVGEARFHAVFDSIGEGLCILEKESDDPVRFRCVETNAAYEREWKDTFPYVDERTLPLFDAVATSGESARFEHERGDGRAVELHVSRIQLTPPQVAVRVTKIAPRESDVEVVQ